MSNHDFADLERDYYMGNYQSCISKANAIPPSRVTNFYMCLSYIHLKKYDNLQLELSKWDDAATKFISLYVEYIRGEKDKRELVQKLDSIVKSIEPDDELSRLIASALYARHKTWAKALQVIDRMGTLVANYSKILVLIMMNRGDLAEKNLSLMMKEDEQAPLTELAQAQVLLVNGNPTHALRIAGSLSDRYKSTPLLYNLQAAAAISLAEYDFAKQLCESALDMDNDNAEALVNMVHILSRLRASAAVLNRTFERLDNMYPDNEIVQGVNQIEVELGTKQ